MMELIFKIPKDKNSIKHYLTNEEKFVSVHPLIFRMQNLGKGRFKVFEKVDIGFIPYRFTYYALITQDGDKVNIEATVMGITKIYMDFTFSEEDNMTLIKEIITIKSPFPIKNFMYKLLKEQHQILFNNIENILL